MAFADSNFKKMADGRTAFFPYGPFGGGWVVDSYDVYERMLFRQRSHLFLAWILCSLSLLKRINVFLVIVLWLFWALQFYIATAKLVSGLEPANEKYTFHDFKASLDDTFAFSALILWFFVLVGMLLVTIGSLALVLPYLVPVHGSYGHQGIQLVMIATMLIGLGALVVYLSFRALRQHRL